MKTPTPTPRERGIGAVVPLDVRPVRVVACWMCGGDGWVEHGQVNGIGRGSRCGICGGRGRIATEGGEP